MGTLMIACIVVPPVAFFTRDVKAVRLAGSTATKSAIIPHAMIYLVGQQLMLVNSREIKVDTVQTGNQDESAKKNFNKTTNVYYGPFERKERGYYCNKEGS